MLTIAYIHFITFIYIHGVGSMFNNHTALNRMILVTALMFMGRVKKVVNIEPTSHAFRVSALPFHLDYTNHYTT